MAALTPRTIVFFKNYFWDFYTTQKPEVQLKIDWTIGLIRDLRIVPEKYFKHLEGTDGLFELRVKFGNNIFRIFCFFDEGIWLYLSTASRRKRIKHPVRSLTGLSKFNGNTTMKNLTMFDEHLDRQYSVKGTASREVYEQGYEAFKLGVLIQEARKKQNLTQEELALRVGTTKNYISRIENDASDIRLTTLMRIAEGLGGQLKLSLGI